jgi:hypothetical protein
MPDSPQLSLEVLQEPPSDVERQCTEIVRFIWPADADECGQTAIGVCAYCGTGVCIRHSDTCSDACILHTGCLDAHESETGHAAELPSHA